MPIPCWSLKNYDIIPRKRRVGESEFPLEYFTAQLPCIGISYTYIHILQPRGIYIFMKDGRKVSLLLRPSSAEYYTHADAEDGPDLVHGVSIGVLADVEEGRTGWQLVPYLGHNEVGELLHAFGRAAHADELKESSIDEMSIKKSAIIAIVEYARRLLRYFSRCGSN